MRNSRTQSFLVDRKNHLFKKEVSNCLRLLRTAVDAEACWVLCGWIGKGAAQKMEQPGG